MTLRILTEVEVARDAFEALKLLANSSVEVLIADVMLPDISGLELAYQALKRNKDLRVILTSGQVPLQSPLPGGVHFLAKPYEFSDVVAAIRIAL